MLGTAEQPSEPLPPAYQPPIGFVAPELEVPQRLEALARASAEAQEKKKGKKRSEEVDTSTCLGDLKALPLLPTKTRRHDMRHPPKPEPVRASRVREQKYTILYYTTLYYTIYYYYTILYYTWECPNVWDFVFLAFRFEMPFHPKSILLEPLNKIFNYK